MGFFHGSAITSKPPVRGRAQCGACGLHTRCQYNREDMLVEGLGGRKVLFVGTSPTGDGPLTGRVRGQVERVLGHLKFDLMDDAWTTNALVCDTPKHKKTGESLPPTPDQIKYCRPNLMARIKELQPDVVIPMGIHATNSVIGGIWDEGIGTMEKWAGWRVPCQKPNVWVCPTWHPSTVATAKDKVFAKQFRQHITAALELEGKPWDREPQYKKMIDVIYDPDEAARKIRLIMEHGGDGVAAFDYETDRLKPEDPASRIVSGSIAWGRGGMPERCIAYPWAGDAITATGEFLRHPIPKIAGNMAFEERWTLAKFGHRVRNWIWDTVLSAHSLDNRPGITSVKFQSFVRLGAPIYNKHIEPFLKTRGDTTVNQILQEVSLNDLLTYNGLDAVYEFLIAVDQMDEFGIALPWAKD